MTTKGIFGGKRCFNLEEESTILKTFICILNKPICTSNTHRTMSQVGKSTARLPFIGQTLNIFGKFRGSW